MNERIQDLKDKLWTEEYWTRPNTDRLLPAQLNRFAELIVRECVEVCAGIAAVRAGYNDADGRDTAYSCGDTIKEHFGVEE